MYYLKVVNIYKKFNDNGKYTINNISFNMEQGEIISILGASGSGKTTLLGIIAGLITQDNGKIIFKGKDLKNTAPYLRNFGMMFQEFALFPHKNVFHNIAFGLEIQKKKKEEIYNRVENILELIGLKGFAQRDVNELSGGERQRVALARTIAVEPKLLMLDEPLGALDHTLREQLLTDLILILKKMKMTTIFVTHDQTEAFTISDRIIILKSGKIEQIDNPEKIYNQPVNSYVAQFLGFKNIIKGTFCENGEIRTSSGIEFGNCKKYLVLERTTKTVEKKITLMIRPDRASIADNHTNKYTDKNDEFIFIHGSVCFRIFQGKYYKIGVKLDTGVIFYFDVSNITPPPLKGGNIFFTINKKDGLVILNDE